MEASERAGVPAVGIFGASFRPMAEILAEQAGLPDHRLVAYPGVMATASVEELETVARTVLTPMIEHGLTADVDSGAAVAAAPASGDALAVVFTGDLDAVQEHFYLHGWTDGLPVIPPTRDRVDAFLAATSRAADEVLGVLAPEKRDATVASVAVNGVMAGCRPEHMPILVAIAECLSDPAFRIEDAGSTPGWEPLVLISGPLARALDFNSETGVMRVGRRANSAVGRFTRLYMRNIAGLRIPPGVTDQAGFGYTFNVAMAENDEAVAQLGAGWPPFRVDRGFEPEHTTVTVQGVVTISSPIYSHGDDPMEHLNVLRDYLARTITPNVAVPTLKRGRGYHLLVMSPSIAHVFADHGMSKDEVRRYLFENTTTRAGFLEYVGRQATVFNLHELVREGRLPADYAASHDPDRPIRVMITEDSLRIAVAGNPGRNQSRAYIGNHAQGIPITRRVEDR